MSYNGESIKCENCGVELKSDMEIEYSRHLTCYFCSPGCAMQHYFEIMLSTPVDFENLNDDVYIKNNNLIQK